ncbi:MAG: hypothetical protein AB7O96_02640 [Pseudobdellovibrionaceae bacterium]
MKALSIKLLLICSYVMTLACAKKGFEDRGSLEIPGSESVLETPDTGNADGTDTEIQNPGSGTDNPANGNNGNNNSGNNSSNNNRNNGTTNNGSNNNGSNNNGSNNNGSNNNGSNNNGSNNNGSNGNGSNGNGSNGNGSNGNGSNGNGSNGNGSNGNGSNGNNGNGNGQQCDSSIGDTEITKPVKVLFVVDQSGSNLSGAGVGPDAVGTDPNKTFRLNVIQDFYNRHHQKSHLSWGFISFGDSSAKAFINAGSTAYPVFSNNSDSFAQAIQTFKGKGDSGMTPYKSALGMIQDLIKYDMSLSSTESNYLVAFITDGVPSDYCADHLANCAGVEDAIDQDLKEVTKLSKKIQFGTVYYGGEDISAVNRLQRMAKVGGGQFVDANKTSVISLDDVIRVPRPCP